MSTRATIACHSETNGRNPELPYFHLFVDLGRPQKVVHLRIEDMPFECRNGCVTITMTEALWKRIAEAYRPGIVEEYLGDG